MPHISFKDQSKKNWGFNNDGIMPKREITNEEIQIGCMQRVADASEKMASNYTNMQDNLAWYKNRYEERGDAIRFMEKRIAALKGAITKLKNKAK